MKTLFASVETLYDLGYRKYLFLNLPPLDRTPGNQAKTNPSPNATQVAWYNEALEAQAGAFGSGRGDVQVEVFDAHVRLAGMLDDPGRFGIANTTGFCAGYDQPDVGVEYSKYGCPVPLEEYFWFNSGHLTSHVHRVLAGELEEWLEGK
jgi:phospholipase/lecithinase/hemolysin